jgi:2-succinyl-5-enolpyruvyl-6-hydroxy-3-cyclohexene-1-carboxylate synthase
MRPSATKALIGEVSMAASTPQTPSAPALRDLFDKLVAEWKELSRYLSNTTQMATLRPYQRIIGMGQPAVPLILEELRREPDHWFWALEMITGENPVPPEAAGQVNRMTEAWLQWGRDKSILTR